MATDKFDKIKHLVEMIQFEKLAMNESKTAIEANAATHEIAQRIYTDQLAYEKQITELTKRLTAYIHENNKLESIINKQSSEIAEQQRTIDYLIYLGNLRS